MRSFRSFRTFVPRPQAPRQLVCFPHAGGAASAFRGWAELLGPSTAVVAVQYPGRQDRFGDPPPADIAALAGQIAVEIAPLLTRPTAFFGHSMGATVAYEVARRLQPRFPSRLARLYVSACDAPPARRPRTTVIADEEIRAYVRSLGGSGAALLADDELWQLSLPALRNDFRMIETYRYRTAAPLTCPVTAIAGDADDSVSPDDVRRWQELTIGPFEAVVQPGGHFYFDESAEGLAALFREDSRWSRADRIVEV
ncbi:Surfactin synthase thioesterase subunit [Lentzea fradiae]|uniref:Surfactin synthase thioesterase subunit n=1 Tax=Lentzea fradiae TaxID=200378 RepID=A0A1G8BKA2_9PSEU|nr:alpha/beta fold hydrolase [Lentzea fradiae]SDH33464.1 Surfactin synthase thioesterase subunit [Lentzea fradiae]